MISLFQFALAFDLKETFLFPVLIINPATTSISTSIKNEKNSLSVNYSGKKKLFASFLSEDRRKKLKRIIEKYSSSSS